MDEADYAKESEMLFRKKALAVHVAMANQDLDKQQLIVDGKPICVDCNMPISKERLEARPEAIRCISCKNEWEKEQARRGR